MKQTTELLTQAKAQITTMQCQPLSSGPKKEESIQNQSNVLTALWIRMMEIYGTARWVRDYGKTPSSTWMTEISKLSTTQIKTGIEAVKQEGSDFIVSLPKFIKLCKGDDHREAFNRFIARVPPKNQVEKLTRGECGYDVRRMEAHRAEALFRKTYEKWADRERCGELPDENVKMIARHSSVAEVHINMEKQQSSGSRAKAAAIMERIKKAKQ